MEFDYIIEKIKTARFSTEPFKHIYLENFLSDEHFNLLTTCKKINILTADSTVNLIKYLEKNGYRIQPFPGCITSVEEYIKCLESNIWPVDKERLEGFGMAFRLAKTSYSEIIKIINFLNGDILKLAIESKFGIVRQNIIETAIHKYLSGYEISPHPDIRSKCLTYLLNINTNNFLESDNIHTHLLKFKPEKNFIYDYWKNNTKYDTDWVPWEWCETKKTIEKNNSIVLFRPSYNTLHAVKLRYNHLSFQRTQIYGNLWYTDVDFQLPLVKYNQFDIKPT